MITLSATTISAQVWMGAPTSQPKKTIGTEAGQWSATKAVDGAIGSDATPPHLEMFAVQWNPKLCSGLGSLGFSGSGRLCG